MLGKVKEILCNLKDFLYEHKFELFVILELILIAFALYHLLKPPETITVMPQEQAETTQGVKQAFENAHLKIDNAQAQEIAPTIREIMVLEKAPNIPYRPQEIKHRKLLKRHRKPQELTLLLSQIKILHRKYNSLTNFLLTHRLRLINIMFRHIRNI